MSKFKIGQIVRAKNYCNCFCKILSIEENLHGDFYIIDGTEEPQKESELFACSLTTESIEKIDLAINEMFTEKSTDELNYILEKFLEFKHRGSF